MVRIATSFLSVAVAIAAVSAAPAVKRQGDITPVIPAAQGSTEGGEGGLNSIDPGAIPSVDPNGTIGGTVDVPEQTAPVESVPVVESTPVDSAPPVVYTQPPVVESVPVVETVGVSHSTVVLPIYGSGSVGGGWHQSYLECVEQCQVENPTPPTVVVIPPSSHGGQVVVGGESTIMSGESTVVSGESTVVSGGVNTVPSGEVSSSTGVTHEIVVEPVAGALHFVPAFVKAALGDAVHFTVMNGVHSIVQSTAVLPCNATGSAFNSGQLTAGKDFTQVISSTDPIFFFSDVGTDCQSGLFGGINANTGNEDSQTTVDGILPQVANANPDVAAALSVTNKFAESTLGLNWGGKIETKDIPANLQNQLVANVLFTRNVMGVNPDMFAKDGSFTPAGEMIVPTDTLQLFAIANAGGYKDVSPDVLPEAQNVAAAANQAPTGGSATTVASRVAVAGVALLAAMFMF